MRSRYKFLEEHGVYFITLVVVAKVQVFKDKQIAGLILESLDYCRKNLGLKIYSYVIMPGHLHLIVSSDSDISNVIKRFKSFTAKAVLAKLREMGKTDQLEIFHLYKKDYKKKSKYQFWQEGSHPKLIEYDVVLDQKMEYIHQNPVRAGYCNNPEDWFLSSYQNIMGNGFCLEIDPVDSYVPNETLGTSSE